MVARMIGNGDIALGAIVSGRIQEVSLDKTLPIACGAVVMRSRVGFLGRLSRNLQWMPRDRYYSKPFPRRQRQLFQN